jgi:hypothetical protein
VSAGFDRDGVIEEALRRSMPRNAPASACLDPETLAALVEGSLAARQREAAHEHLADCARCQATLAALVRTLPPAVKRPWWRLVPVGWLVPLAAAATALVVWIAVPQRSVNPSRSVAEPVVTPTVPSAPSEPTAAVPTENTERRDAAKESARADADRAPLTGDRARSAIEPPRLDAPQSNQPADESRQAREEAAASPAPSAAQAAASSALSAPAAAPAAPPTAAAAPAARAFNATADSFAKVAGANAVTGGVVDIVSPNPLIRWRLSGRSVQQSADGGATWQPQTVAASGDLLAGSSPALTVCWIVGRSGTVLLTIDGRQWKVVMFPEMVDLTAVRATDARTAFVTTAGGRMYRTSDGGMSWQ